MSSIGIGVGMYADLEDLALVPDSLWSITKHVSPVCTILYRPSSFQWLQLSLIHRRLRCSLSIWNAFLAHSASLISSRGLIDFSITLLQEAWLPPFRNTKIPLRLWTWGLLWTTSEKTISAANCLGCSPIIWANRQKPGNEILCSNIHNSDWPSLILYCRRWGRHLIEVPQGVLVGDPIKGDFEKRTTIGSWACINSSQQ